MNINSSKAVQAAMFYADSYDDASGPIWFQKYNEKFAELIIRECCDQVMFHEAELIKEHFGVEE